jgi:hypothetical protein
MSDYLAIGGVSAVLRSLLTNAAQIGGPASILSAQPAITNLAPDLIETSASEPAQINLFMYSASINASMRNLDLPSANSQGQRKSNPPLALNLHYLVSAYGGKAFDQEILLGFAMQVFHKNSEISRQQISDALADLLAATPATDEAQLVAAGTLAGQMGFLHITPEVLSTEEMYRLWTAFQASYRPTTSYQVSVVLIQSDDAFVSNPPVRNRSVVALPMASPIIASVEPVMAEVGESVMLKGRNFLGDALADTSASFDEGTIPVVLDTAQSTLLRLTVPATLTAGVHTLRVRRAVTYPSSSTPHTGFSSSPTPIQVLPKIQNATPVAAKRSTPLTLTVVPEIGRTQRVVFFFGDRAHPIEARKATDAATSPTVTMDVPADMPLGKTSLRIEVDGAQSRLTQDMNTASPTFGQWLPQVEVSA